MVELNTCFSHRINGRNSTVWDNRLPQTQANKLSILPSRYRHHKFEHMLVSARKVKCPIHYNLPYTREANLQKGNYVNSPSKPISYILKS
jgi:hypothetical protein